MRMKDLSPYFLLALVAGAALLVAQIFTPFLVPIVLAAAFAAVLYPPYLALRRLARGSSTLAAIGVLIIVILVLLVPLGFALVVSGWEIARLYGSIVSGSFAENISFIVRSVQHSLPTKFFGQDYSTVIADNLSAYAQTVVAWLSGRATDAFSSIMATLFNLFIFFIALFYFLRDGDQIKKAIIELSPLNHTQDAIIFDHLALAVNSVVRGNLLIALVRAALSTFGFFIFGIPNPLLWGIFAGLLGLIPAIGIFLVFVPAVLYAYFMLGWADTIGLASCGMAIFVLVDNLFAPFFFGKQLAVHPLLVLLSILGGISYFGPLGIILGPLSLSLFFALLSVYAAPEQK